MPRRPYTLLSCAVSVDGCLDDTSAQPLILSGPEDLAEIDDLRAACDAILVGAGTIRADNPGLLVRSPERPGRATSRRRPGDPDLSSPGSPGRATSPQPHPLRVTLTATANLDPAARFFTGPGTPLVYCAAPAVATARARFGESAVVIDAGDPPSLGAVFQDLYSERSVATVLVEGGARILRDVLAADLADELRLAIAPFFVGDPEAPRFGLPARYPHTPANPMTLAAARRLGNLTVLHYLLTTRERPATLPRPWT